MTQDAQKEPISFSKLSEIFNLSYDQAHPDKIDNDIRDNVKVAGTNLWILMFAILVASIGLNMNSTAVIIGAMLISPLMGPIVGVGYGTAVFDIKLIKISLRNLLIFIIISLITATLYFAITPLTVAQSELLARTQPTLWDVLIAFFGGSAGMIAMTRKEGSNVIPGVAIATALMPPLCTAGYGLSQGNWSYFFGAFYLFTINGVFIAFASLLFARLLKLPRRGLLSHSQQKRQQALIWLIVLAVMLPSGYLATQMVRQELFTNRINHLIKSVQKEHNFWVLQNTSSYQDRSLRLIINGSGNTQAITDTLHHELDKAGIHGVSVSVFYAGGEQNLNDIYEDFKNSQTTSSATLSDLQAQLDKQSQYIKTLESQTQHHQDHAKLLKELHSQYKSATHISVSTGKALTKPIQKTDTPDNQNSQNPSEQPTTLIWLELPTPMSDDDKQTLKDWLDVRLDGQSVQLLITQTP